MSSLRLVAAAFLLAALFSTPAKADILIDNVNGLTLDEDGKLERFTGILIGDNGRIEEIYRKQREKRPKKVDYKLDAKGLTLIPGLIDSHAHVMKSALALIAPKTGTGDPGKNGPRPEDRDLALAKLQERLLSGGVTTVADIGTTIEDWQTYRRAGDLDVLRVRIVSYAKGVDNMILIGGPSPTPWLYDGRLKMNGLALKLDGHIDTRDAWLKAPYADTPGKSGKPLIDDTQLRNLMSRGAIDTFQVAVIAHGDAAVSATLDAIDELSETYKGERRWRIDDLQCVDTSDLARFAKHGTIVAIDPLQIGPQSSIAEARLGAGRLPAVQPSRSLIDNSASVVFAARPDASGKPEPFAAMAAALTRQDDLDQPFGGWQPQERITREKVLDAFTRSAAHALMAESRLGHIAKGLPADFLLIDTDPLLSTPRELRNTEVLQTWIGGKLVFETENRPAPSR